MKLTITHFGLLQPSEQTSTAETVAQYTQGGADEELQMLPVTVQDIFAKYVCYVAQDTEAEQPQFAGFIAATQPEIHGNNSMSEVGTMYIAPQYRKQGIATLLLHAITTDLEGQDITPFAFVNPNSKPIFTNTGYTKADTLQLPSSVFIPCQSCPMLPITGGCCDEQVIKEQSNDSN